MKLFCVPKQILIRVCRLALLLGITLLGLVFLISYFKGVLFFYSGKYGLLSYFIACGLLATFLIVVQKYALDLNYDVPEDIKTDIELQEEEKTTVNKDSNLTENISVEEYNELVKDNVESDDWDTSDIEDFSQYDEDLTSDIEEFRSKTVDDEVNDILASMDTSNPVTESVNNDVDELLSMLKINNNNDSDDSLPEDLINNLQASLNDNFKQEYLEELEM